LSQQLNKSRATTAFPLQPDSREWCG